VLALFVMLEPTNRILDPSLAPHARRATHHHLEVLRLLHVFVMSDLQGNQEKLAQLAPRAHTKTPSGPVHAPTAQSIPIRWLVQSLRQVVNVTPVMPEPTEASVMYVLLERTQLHWVLQLVFLGKSTSSCDVTA